MASLASTLSPNEMKILAAAWISCEVPPKPDYKIIAEICGYTPGSASVMYGGVRRKLEATKTKLLNGDADTSAEAGDDTAEKTPKSAKKRASPKKKDDAVGSPKKRARKTKEEAAVDESAAAEKADIKTEKPVKQEPQQAEDSDDGVGGQTSHFDDAMGE